MDAFSCQLVNEGLLHITGPDTQTFLQGQTTCDTRELNAVHALPGVYCTPQGRVVCDFLLLQLGPEHCALRMRASIIEHAAAVFGKYIIFSKAEIQAGRTDWQVFACWGGDAAKAIAQVFGATPEQQFGAISSEHYTVVQLDDAGTAFECYVNTQAAAELCSQLESATERHAQETWQALAVRSGIARIERATVEEFVPQTLNYDLTGHISFSKGCYTGQEVVARLHYRGTPKRRSYVVCLPDGLSAAVGDKVYCLESGKVVGDVVNVITDNSATVALVSATAESASSGLSLNDGEGPALRLQKMPYSLSQE